MVNADDCSESLTVWFLFTISVVVVFLFVVTSLGEETALVWQAARVVAMAKAQARRKVLAGDGRDSDRGNDKGSDMIGSTYIKRQLVSD